MRTIVTTTNQTTYVVTDRDIIEALVGLGIPRTVLLSEDTTFKASEYVRHTAGFDFSDNNPDDTFLTVEGAVESAAPVKEEKEEEVYPNGTVLVGQYTGKEYTIRGYNPVSQTYLTQQTGYDVLTSLREFVHNPNVYRVKTPAPEKKQEHPVGTVFIGKYTGNKYTVTGYDEKKDRYQIRRADGTIFSEEADLLNRDYTLQPAPVKEEEKEEVHPVGTVLVGRYSGNEFVVLGYNEDREEYTVRSKHNGIETGTRRGFNGNLFKVKTPVGTATIQEEVYPVGTVLLRDGREYAVASYNTTTGVYVLNAVSGPGWVHAKRALVHDPKEYPLKPAVPTTPADRLPVGSVVKYKRYNGTEDLCYITGYVDHKYGEGYSMWNVNAGTKTWEHYSSVHRVDGCYTVVYKADPSKATPTFKDAFPVGTVLKHENGFVSVLTGYRGTDFGDGYTTYTSTWGEGYDYHRNFVSDRYTVLYNPSEQDEQSKT